ncbi:MAG: dephospho-CoA kinase [Bacteroidales bacterium]
MIKIGLTGGIGAGKSVVSELLRVMGYPVFDTDREAKRLMNESEELRTQLINLFGEETYTATGLNRPYLASLIFNDPCALAQMNRLVHPLVRRRFEAWAAAQESERVFLESAILFESDFHKMLDEIWSVSAPESLRTARVMSRDGVSADRVKERLSAQLPQEKKDEMAHHVIFNDGSKPLIPQIFEALQGSHP